MKKSISVFVATHKYINFQLPDYCKKVEVNCSNKKSLWENYYHDNEGDNISSKNFSYSELSVLYWAWKNRNDDIKGLCHYRRFFTNDQTNTVIPIIKTDINHVIKDCLTEKEIKKLLQDNDIILTKPYLPYPKTVLDELREYCYEADINILYRVIKEDYPEYFETLKLVLEGKNASYYNMMIAEKKIFDEYCSWIFSVLEKMEQKCNIEQYDTQHKRLYGYMSEVLLNVYVRKNKLKCAYCKVGFLEENNTLKRKIRLFILRNRNKLHKFFYRKKIYVIIEKIYKIFHPAIYLRLKNYSNYEKKNIN